MRLSFLTDVYANPGPYATVYLHERPVGEDAAGQLQLRWRSLAQRLQADGADAASLKALEATVTGQPRRPGMHPGTVTARGRALAAAEGTILLDRPLSPETASGPSPLTDDLARWGPLPHLLPLLWYEQRPAPHLLVVADRTGADIHLMTDGLDHVTVVEGEERPLTKVPAGGWSHRRFRQRAENTWEHNATRVAGVVSGLATRHRANLVLLAGDVRARAAICDHLPATVRRTVVESEHGGRAPGAAEAPLRQELARRAADSMSARHATVVERFAQHRREGTRTAEGLARVIDAVRAGNLDTLLLSQTGAEERVWVGPGADQVALTRIELEHLGLEEYAADRADAALIRGCVANGAELELLTPDDPVVADGAAALLRYPI
ncbi:MAG: Vms1/Ankzf1 family peptidyl-tRNA hydrolase [Micromonosporaceae bacterium]